MENKFQVYELHESSRLCSAVEVDELFMIDCLFHRGSLPPIAR